MPANKVGISLATVGVLSDVDTTQRNMLGASVEDETGGVYVYLQGVASTVAGDWVIYNSATFLTTRLVTAILAGPIAVAMAALLLNNFGWYQIGGIVLSANIASDAAANGKPLYASATPGRATTTAAAGTAIFGASGQGAAATNVGNAYLACPPFTMANATL